MINEDLFQLEQQKRQAEKRKAQELFGSYKISKLTVKHPVFFVPGWTDEWAGCWQPLKESLKQILTNPDKIFVINFFLETIKCKSFLDFGEVLKPKIKRRIDLGQKFDVVGHSMGGLDIRAAFTQGNEPLLNCRKCITVATPHWGDNFGGMRYAASKSIFSRLADNLNPLKGTQYEQGKNLDPDYPPIKLVDTLENRKLFLERVDQLYQLKGTQDFVVKGSAILNPAGIEELYEVKSKEYTVEGVNHTGSIGICQDIRTMILIVHLLLDLPVPEDKNNFGDLLGGNYKPGENPDRFV